MASAWGWSEKNQETWSKARAKGKWNFVLVSGVVAWGVPMFLVMACAPVFLGFPYRVSPSMWYWIWQPLLWAVSGFVYGIAVWHWSEKQYLKHEQETSNT